MNMVLTSIKRRKKDIRYVSVVTFIAVFFVMGINLFQDIMNQYVMEQNYKNYGDWILSSVGTKLEHPYLEKEGFCITGPVLVNEEGNALGVYLGAMDSNALEIGKISLYEGRMPELQDEIVMDLVSLAKMGYSYELGQNISICCLTKNEDGEETVQQKTYRLVGTVKSFASRWKTVQGYYLPNVLVTEEALQNYQISYQTYFYSLDRAYKDLDTAEFSEAFTKENRMVVYNNYVYENQLWGSADTFEMISYVMIAIAVLAIGYLFSSYTSKRTGVYYRYRCMGMTKRQVRQVIGIEGLYAMAPVTAAGILLPYLIAWIACTILADINDLPYFFVFNGVLFLRQMIFIILVVSVSIVWAMLRTRQRNLLPNVGVIRRSGFKKLRRMAAKSRHPERELYKRYNRLHPIQRFFSVLFTILVCGSLVFCVQHIYETITVDYMMGFAERSDFSMNKTVNHYWQYLDSDGLTVRGGGSCYDMYDGADTAAQAELALAVGIDQMENSVCDSAHYVQWTGLENSPMLQALEQNGDDGSMAFYRHCVFNFFEDASVAQGVVQEKGGGESLDWDAWLAGEQVIVLLQTSFATVEWDEDMNPIWDTVEVYDQTIQPGDTLEIRKGYEDAGGDISTTVTVAAVYYISGIEYSFDYSSDTFTAIASGALAERIAENEGGTLEPNKYDILFNQLASYEATDKQLAAFAVSHGFTYTSYAEYRRALYYTIVRKIAVYGIVFVLILIVYIALQKNFINSRRRYQREQYILMKQLGMDDVRYLKRSLWEKGKEYLWLYAGIIASYIAVAYMTYRSYEKEGFAEGVSELSCRLINDFTADTKLLTLDYLIYDIGHVWIILMVTGLFLIMMVNSFLLIKNMKTEGK